MDYREQIEMAKNAAEKWHKNHPIVGVGELRVDLMVDDLARSITDLLDRAEAAEAWAHELEPHTGLKSARMGLSAWNLVEFGRHLQRRRPGPKKRKGSLTGCWKKKKQGRLTRLESQRSNKNEAFDHRR